MPTNVEVKPAAVAATTVNGLSGAVVLAAGSGITLTPVGQTITISSGADLNVTLLDVSANSTTAPNSIYNLTATIPVIFKSSDGNTMLYLDETNERIGIGNVTSPTSQVEVTSGVANVLAGIFNASGSGDNIKPAIRLRSSNSNTINNGISLEFYGQNASTALFGNIFGRYTTGASSGDGQIGIQTSTGGVLTTRVLFDNTGQTTFSSNGAASTPILTGTGTWFSGGTATTTKPYWLIEPTGTTSTGWSTSGTGLGINAASGFGGNLVDAHLDGVSKFKVDKDGIGNFANSINIGGNNGVLCINNGTSVDGNLRAVRTGSGNSRLYISNIGASIGDATIGTSGDKVLGFEIGTAPTTVSANTFQIFAKDSSAGSANATLGLFTEQSVETGVAVASTNKLRVWLNNGGTLTEYYVLLTAV